MIRRDAPLPSALEEISADRISANISANIAGMFVALGLGLGLCIIHVALIEAFGRLGELGAEVRAGVVMPLALATGWLLVFAVSCSAGELHGCDAVVQGLALGNTYAPYFWRKLMHGCWHTLSGLVAYIIPQAAAAVVSAAGFVVLVTVPPRVAGAPGRARRAERLGSAGAGVGGPSVRHV